MGWDGEKWLWGPREPLGLGWSNFNRFIEMPSDTIEDIAILADMKAMTKLKKANRRYLVGKDSY